MHTNSISALWERAPPPRAAKGGEVFRLAVLGDFSARANRGEVEVGETLAAA